MCGKTTRSGCAWSTNSASPATGTARRWRGWRRCGSRWRTRRRGSPKRTLNHRMRRWVKALVVVLIGWAAEQWRGRGAALVGGSWRPQPHHAEVGAAEQRVELLRGPPGMADWAAAVEACDRAVADLLATTDWGRVGPGEIPDQPPQLRGGEASAAGSACRPVTASAAFAGCGSRSPATCLAVPASLAARKANTKRFTVDLPGFPADTVRRAASPRCARGHRPDAIAIPAPAWEAGVGPA